MRGWGAIGGTVAMGRGCFPRVGHGFTAGVCEGASPFPWRHVEGGRSDDFMGKSLRDHLRGGRMFWNNLPSRRRQRGHHGEMKQRPTLRGNRPLDQGFGKVLTGRLSVAATSRAPTRSSPNVGIGEVNSVSVRLGRDCFRRAPSAAICNACVIIPPTGRLCGLLRAAQRRRLSEPSFRSVREGDMRQRGDGGMDCIVAGRSGEGGPPHVSFLSRAAADGFDACAQASERERFYTMNIV